jgi:capsid protein
VDPLKEANAQATRLQNHTTTLAEEFAKRGRDWEAELRQRSKELTLMRELGLQPAELQPTNNNSAPVPEEDEYAPVPESDD